MVPRRGGGNDGGISRVNGYLSGKPYHVVPREGRDLLGEGLLWSAARQQLLWVDIHAPALHMLDLKTQRVRSWAMPEKIGWVVERAGRGDFLIGLKTDVAVLSLEPFAISDRRTLEPERPQNRLNDAAVDSSGRLWTGTLNEVSGAPTGALYRIDKNMSFERQDDGYRITNGPTFDLTGRILFHADTLNRTIYAFDLSPNGGLSRKRPFLVFEESWGYPDGMCTDSEGGIWVAHWGGGRVSRFTSEGVFDRSIAVPATQVTNCVFAGENLDRMFLTSAAAGVDEPHAGSLFEIDPGIRGTESYQFRG